MSFFYQTLDTKMGTLHLVSNETKLKGVAFNSNWERLSQKFSELRSGKSEIIALTKLQLTEYLAGARTEFELPFELDGTEFQKKVWLGLSQIPFGQTSSYQDQAARLAMPTAVRALARTQGLNPLSIVLPCHRVIGKNGSLTGYAGGLIAKQFLLTLERVSI